MDRKNQRNEQLELNKMRKDMSVKNIQNRSLEISFHKKKVHEELKDLKKAY